MVAILICILPSKKLLNAEKTVLKKDYGFVEIFSVLDEINNKHNKLYDYKPRTPNKINTKLALLNYLRTIGLSML